MPVVSAPPPPRCVLSPWSFRFGVHTHHSPVGALSSWVERRLELLLQESSLNCPGGSFCFWENPPVQSCCSIHGRACPLTQLTSPTRPGMSGSGPHTAQLSTIPHRRPVVFVGLPLRPYCPYSPSCNLKQPGLSHCCSTPVWQGKGAVNSALPGVLLQAWRARAWGYSHPGPCAGPGAGPRDLFVLKQSPYRLFFQFLLYFLVSCLLKHWGTVGCLVCSSVDWVGVSPMCRGKLTPLAPISPPSFLVNMIFRWLPPKQLTKNVHNDLTFQLK